jgi:hypothetical protein
MSDALARRGLPQALLYTLLFLLVSPSVHSEEEPTPPPGDASLRWLDPSAPDYRTPRAGEGFRTRIFGRDVENGPRDRRSTSAWDVGAATWYRYPEDEQILPFGSLYFWRRPSERWFFRGTVVGVYNDLTYAHSLVDESPFEGVLTFESQTIPTDSAEYADGERLKREELLKGEVRPGVGFGYRRQVESGFGFGFLDEVPPQAPDNQLSLSATVEPEFLYFHKGKDTVSNFRVPGDTFGLRGHLRLRWDQMERNLLDLVHHGFAFGMDGTQGWRERWRDWGIDERESAGDGRLPRLFQGYTVVAGGIPGVSEKHRLIGSVHGGVGGNLDRFSAPSIGGGPSGDEFGAISRPLVPGAGIGEFWPDHYAIGVAEYRYELFFFTYLSARGSVAWLDRDRLDANNEVDRRNNVLTSLGSRLTTGFLFSTRLQFDYNYNFDVIRDDHHRGASEWLVHVSRSF